MIDLNKPVNFAPINKKLRLLFYSDLYCFFAGVTIYLVLVFYWLPNFQYRINPDGISYILVAQKIVQGEFIQAVNGYWGIGFPLLIVGFLKITAIPILAAKYALIISGGIYLIGAGLFINLFIQNLLLKRIAFFSNSLLVPAFVFEVVTSDLLFAGLFLIYLSYLLLAIQIKKVPNLIVGLLGGLMYLTRENGLYFFIVHFLGFILFFHFYIKKFNKSELVKIGSIFVIALVISGIFIGGQYYKYEKVNIGSRLQYILSWIRPDSPGLFTFTQGFLPLPSDLSENIWEDPTYHKIEYWNPLSNLKFAFNNFITNSISLVNIINLIAFTLLPMSLISLIWFIYRGNKVILFFFLFTPLLYVAGFLVTYVGSETRYFWSILFLLYILITIFLDQIIFYDPRFLKFVIILSICSSISFIYKPIISLIGFAPFNLDSQYVSINSQLQRNRVRSERIIGSNHHFAESMYISFYSENKYIGQSTRFIDINKSIKIKPRKWTELEKDFQEYKLDYYLYWEKDENEQNLLNKYHYIQLENANAKLFKISGY